jgi:hypothetical protein
MFSVAVSSRAAAKAFTIVEVLVSAVLILLALGSILAINTKSMHTLRATRQAAASSQILQQRVEAIRGKPWPEISNSAILKDLIERPAESEKELADFNLTEFINVSVPATTEAGAMDAGESFSIRRQNGRVRVITPGDFGKETTLLFESTISWRDVQGSHERKLRTIICRAGLTRSGVFGSSLGRPGPGIPNSPRR